MRLTHVRLLVEGFGASFRFYRDVLGIRVAYIRDPDHNLIELNHSIPSSE